MAKAIVKIKDDSAIKELKKYGCIISRLCLINAVGMDIDENKIEKIKKIEGVESVKLTGVAKALR